MNFSAELTRLGASGTPFNNADAWGFGGGIGTSYALENGAEFRRGRVNIRNGRPRRFARFIAPDGTDCHDTQALRQLQALPTPEALAQERLLDTARTLLTPPAPRYTQGGLF